jgi:hypothetical protein
MVKLKETLNYTLNESHHINELYIIDRFKKSAILKKTIDYDYNRVYLVVRKKHIIFCDKTVNRKMSYHIHDMIDLNRIGSVTIELNNSSLKTFRDIHFQMNNNQFILFYDKSPTPYVEYYDIRLKLSKAFVHKYKSLKNYRLRDASDDYLLFTNEKTNTIALVHIRSQQVELIEYSLKLYQVIIFNDSSHLLATSEKYLTLFKRYDNRATTILFEQDIRRVLKEPELSVSSYDLICDENFFIFHCCYENNGKALRIL